MLRVVLVDDNPDDRTLVNRELRRAFDDIQITEIDTQATFDHITRSDTNDIFIVDYQLGWNDGLTLLRTLKTKLPHRPVVMFTATGTEEVAVEAMKEGLDDYIVKSLTHYIRLPAAIERALERAEMHQLAERFASEREQMLESERAARQEAEQAVRLRDQFLSLAAHELKTPLTALFGHAQVIERRANRDAQYTDRDRQTITTVVEQAMRLNKLISNLLDISRIQTGQLILDRRTFDMSAFLRRVTTEFTPLLEHHLLTVDIPPEPMLINGDELRLEQVINNLLQNAVRYSAQGTEIAVHAAAHDGSVAVSVRDQGIGIPKDVRERIFERFFRAPNVNPRQINGMGVGLYVVHEIVGLHKGTVKVASEEGKGSTFTVTLPR